MDGYSTHVSIIMLKETTKRADIKHSYTTDIKQSVNVSKLDNKKFYAEQLNAEFICCQYASYL
jgi:hypothetical protein